jgi:AGZA family xanthine/uracil permease-like MFS transporter
VALACVPALAYLVNMMTRMVLDDRGLSLDQLTPMVAEQLFTSRILANGFIITSLLWGATLAAIIDRHLRAAAGYCLIAALLSLFGVIHSPLVEAPIALPWHLQESLQTFTATRSMQTPYWMAGSSALVAVTLFAWHWRLEQPATSQPSPSTRRSRKA